MKYICHNRYKGKTMDGSEVLVRRKKELVREGDTLFYEGKAVCIHRSLVGKQHFAVNDDGKGLERGLITYALAYAPRPRWSEDKERPRQQRFTDAELKTLSEKWSQYLKPNIDMLLFNDAFFEENPDVLREIAASVNVDIPNTN